MKEKRIFPPLLEWPRWKFPNKWFKFIPSIFSFFVFFFQNLELKYQIITFSSLFLLLPILIQTLLWLKKFFSIIQKRTKYYKNLYDHYQKASSELGELKELFLNRFINDIQDKIHKIDRAKYQRDKLYIVIKNNLKLNLKNGNKIVVYDKMDLVYLGQFEITEVRNSEYFAIGVKDIDAVWLSYVREKGETTILPNLTAIYLPSGE